jgi:hypothetical protein
MSKTTDRPTHTNLSPSRTSDGISKDAAAIPAVTPAADRRSDSGGEVVDPHPPAPPARTSRRGFIMNSIVSAAAVASATAIPSLDQAAPVNEAASPSAALVRAEQVVNTLRSSYVRENWKIEENDAEHALAYMRKYAAGKETEDHEQAVMEMFFGCHGQSLDWIFRGDVGGMICMLAARSFRAGLVTDGKLFDMVDQHKMAFNKLERLEAVWRELDDRRCNSKRMPRGYKAAERRMYKQGDIYRKLEERIVGTPANTIDGIIAKARALNLNLTDGESAEEGQDVDFGVSIAHDLLALGDGHHEVMNRPEIAADPIFAAIEAHRGARQGYEQACDAHSRAEEKYPAETQPEVRIKVGERPETEISIQPNNRGGNTIESYPSGRMIPIYAKTWLDIDEHAPTKLDDRDRAQWIDARRAELDAEEERLFADWQKTELGQLDIAMAEAFDVEDRKTRDLVWTAPTTAQGLAALLGYCRELSGFMGITHAAEWATALEWTIERAACSLAGLPKPPMSKLIRELWELKQQEDAEALVA